MRRGMFAGPCTCNDPLFFTDDPEHCFRCGHGPCVTPPTGRARRRRRLPWDLGALQREGRRPDPHLENVVRLERLRDRWKVPPLFEAEQKEPSLTAKQRRVVALMAAGLSNGEIARALGVSGGRVSQLLGDVYVELGFNENGVGRFSRARTLTVEWWNEIHGGELAA